MNDAASFFGKKLKSGKKNKAEPSDGGSNKDSGKDINLGDTDGPQPEEKNQISMETEEIPIQSDKEIEQELIEDIKNDVGSETNLSDNGEGISDGETDEVGESPNKKFQVFISGQLLLGISDAIFPAIILKGSKFIGYKHGKKRSDLMLTDGEKEMLEPIADQAAIEIFDQLTPLQQFFIAMGAIYGSKL